MTTIKEFFYEVIIPTFLLCIFFISLVYLFQHFECRAFAKVNKIETFTTFPIGCFVKTADGVIPANSLYDKQLNQ